MKKDKNGFFKARLLSLICLVILLLPSYGWSKASRVAVLPWKVNSAENMEFVKSAMADMFSSRLGSSGSVELIRPDIVKGAIGDKEITDDSASDIGKKLKADYVLYGSLTVLGGSVSMDARLLNVKNGAISPFYSKSSGIDSVIGMTDKVSNDVLSLVAGPVATLAQPAPPLPGQAAQPVEGMAAVMETLPPKQAQKETKDDFIIRPSADAKAPLWKSKTMEGLYTAVVAADINKDGVKELILLSKNNIVIAKRNADGLQVIKEIKAEPGVENIAITSIDSDRDGLPEVFISSVRNDKPYSSMLEFKNGEYKITSTGISWLMRTIEVKKGEPVLIGQKFRKPDGFYGDLHILEKKGAGLADKGPFEVKLPKKVDIYRFEAFDLTNSGSPELLAFDDRDYIDIYKKSGGDKWEKAWKSRDFYGGTLNNIDFGEDRPGIAAPESIPVEGRFFRLEHNGKKELIIKKNVPGGLGRFGSRPGSYKSGEVLSLSLAEGDSDFTENWKTRLINGYIADFFIDDIEGEGFKEITMLVVEAADNLFSKPKSYVLSYRLSI